MPLLLAKLVLVQVQAPVVRTHVPRLEHSTHSLVPVMAAPELPPGYVPCVPPTRHREGMSCVYMEEEEGVDGEEEEEEEEEGEEEDGEEEGEEEGEGEVKEEVKEEVE